MPLDENYVHSRLIALFEKLTFSVLGVQLCVSRRKQKKMADRTSNEIGLYGVSCLHFIGEAST